MKRYFHEELESVRSQLMLMGERAIDNVKNAMAALIDNDLAKATAVIKADDEINAVEKQIDDEVARYIGLRAPVARDLRLLFVTIKASHDLERVGDEASSIASRMKKVLAEGVVIDDFGHMPRMCEVAIGMLQDSLHCFIDEDEEKAISIWMRDREVDSLNRDTFRRFVELMREQPDRALELTELVFMSKSFERIADHAKNIAEEVYFLLTARPLKPVIKDAKRAASL